MQIAWFSTGKGDGSKGLLKYIKEKNVKISYVFCNREKGEYKETDSFLEMIENYNIPNIRVSSKNFKPKLWQENREKWREKYDKKVIKALKHYKTDIGMLAGYMLITGKKLCNKYDLINLHPALPDGPKGAWREVIWEIISANKPEHGVMIHLITPEPDRGPVITYCKFEIRGSKKFDSLWANYYRKRKTKTLQEIIKEEGENEPLFKEIRKQGFTREKPLIYHTLKLFAEGKIRIENKSILKDGKILKQGCDLTELVSEGVY